MNIPYTTERRADTGVNNVALGMWLFIASEVMLFGALFSSYALLRASATDWPSGQEFLSLPFGSFNTILLIGVTALIWRARNSPVDKSRRQLVYASLLACVFPGVKSIEWSGEIGRGFLPHVNTFLAMYFTLTALHAAHVIAGIVANVWVFEGRVDAAMRVGRVKALALYWVFVDIVWLIIFGLLYLS